MTTGKINRIRMGPDPSCMIAQRSRCSPWRDRYACLAVKALGLRISVVPERAVKHRAVSVQKLKVRKLKARKLKVQKLKKQPRRKASTARKRALFHA
jgi:hypothetical protein